MLNLNKKEIWMYFIWLHIIESGQLFSLLSFNVLPVPKQSGTKSEYEVNQSRSGALLSPDQGHRWLDRWLQQIQIVYICSCCRSRSVSKDERQRKRKVFEIRMDSIQNWEYYAAGIHLKIVYYTTQNRRQIRL